MIYPELSYQIVGILFKIHSDLGNRYQEKYYQRAVEVSLKRQHIPYKKELPVPLSFENHKIGKYFLDFLIDEKVILELKTVAFFHRKDFQQVSAYLKAKHLKLGILANFKTPSLTYKRILNSSV